MPQKYKNILVINTFGIGDVLFSTPIIRILKKYIPNAHIDFMCNKRCQYIWRNNKNIGNIIIFEKDEFRGAFKKSKIMFIKKLFNFAKRIKQKNYDLAIDLSLGYQISLLLKLLGIKHRIGFNYRNRGKFLTDKVNIDGFNDKCVVEYYLDILKLINIINFTTKNLEFPLSPEIKRWADNFIIKNGLKHKRLIGIAPGGGKSWGKYAVYRRWSPRNFSYVAQKLSKKSEDLFFLIFGSEEEKQLGQAIKERISSKSINLCGTLPIPRSVALIERCKLLLCNDGGMLHIAVSQGVSTVSIFGPVDDKVYGPYPPSNRHKVVKAENAECRPCYRSFRHKICETHDCLKKIDKDSVVRLAEQSIDERMITDGERR